MQFLNFQVMMSKMLNLFSNKKRYSHIDAIHFDDFKNYQHAHDDKDVYLTPTGWKILIDKVLSPIIEKELGMTYIGNCHWADSFDNHRRRVLSLVYVNSAFATFKWGWNFDFIPKKSGKKLIYARTDKTVHSHIFEMSRDFYNNTKKRKNTTISAFGSKISDYPSSIKEMCKAHIDAFYFLLPLIKKYYKATDSYINTLKRIDHNLENGYFKVMNSEIQIAKAFIEYASGNCDFALSYFKNIKFLEDNEKNEYQKFFDKLDKITDIT